MLLPTADRILMECELEPVQGSRFQPTGFPSLGPAEFSFTSADGKNIKALLLESAQSMANRLEAVCIDTTGAGLVDPLSGIPLITVKDKDGAFLTNSVVEAHRMNSPYMLEGADTTLFERLKTELNIEDKDGVVDIPKFARFVFKYDTNSILHGLFLSKSNLAGGRYKLTRVLSSFIEATDVQPVISGGVKLDHVSPSGGDAGAEKGYGHIPYSRTEYTATSIKCYFSVDVALIRSYRLDSSANELVFTLALWKIRSFLAKGLRLRTACDLRVKSPLVVTQPDGFGIPDLASLDKGLKQAIDRCKDAGLFADPPLHITYSKPKK